MRPLESSTTSIGRPLGGCPIRLFGTAFLLLATQISWIAIDNASGDALSLAWDRCAAAGGPANQSFGCATNAAAFTLAATIQSDTLIDGVIGAELVVDLQAESASFPDWWALGQGGCRAGRLQVVFDSSPATPCLDAWSGAATGQLQDQIAGMPRGLANQSRLLLVAAVLSPFAVTFQAGSVYELLEVSILANGTVPDPPACAGCSFPVCLVLNSARLIRLGGGTRDFTFAPGGGTNLATWQSATGPTCAAVPVRMRTWGAIKGLYR